VIAVGCATTDEQAFRAGGALAMEALDEGDSLLLRRYDRDSVAVSCNEILAMAAGRNDLEAIVLVHEGVVIERAALALALIRRLLVAAPDVAVVGAVDGGYPRDVAAVDGTLLAVAPWVAGELRFDPSVGGSADVCAVDFSLGARAAGHRVVGAHLGVVRAGLRMTPSVRRRQLRAMVRLRRKWDDDALGGIPFASSARANCHVAG
jgi:hypothetical protein